MSVDSKARSREDRNITEEGVIHLVADGFHSIRKASFCIPTARAGQVLSEREQYLLRVLN